MPIDFYLTPGSAPCRNVWLAAKALGIDLNLRFLNLMAGEHLSPEFVKLNPQHCVPAINDDGFVLTESRAIMIYLAERYGKDDSFYPKDPKKQAVVNQRLYFDMGTLYARFGELYYPIIFGGAPYDDEKAKRLDEALQFLDGFLAKSEFVAGDKLTLADLSTIASISTIEVVGYDITKFTNVLKWYNKTKTLIPGYKEANEDGLQQFKALYESKTKK